jgi:hypothetical protein
MTSFFPTGVGFVLLGALILSAYLVKRRREPLRVSALFLWRTPGAPTSPTPRFKRLQTRRSLFFELLAVFLGALFLAEPHCGPTSVPHVTLVLDGTFSMQADADNSSSVADNVKSFVSAQLEQHRDATVTLIESGAEPRVLCNRANRQTAVSVLSGWTPQRAPHNPIAALNLALSLLGAAQAPVYFLTDGAPRFDVVFPARVTPLAFGTPQANLAITAAQRTPTQVAVTLFNASDTSTAPVIELNRSGLIESRSLAIGARATLAFAVAATPETEVRITLPQDALASDNVFTFFAAPLKKVRLEFLDGLDERTIRLVTKAAEASMLLDNASPITLRVGPPSSDADFTVGAIAPLSTVTGPFFFNRNEALLDDVWLDGVTWTAGANPPGRPLLTHGDQVLLAESDDGRLHLNHALAQSTLTTQAAWPLLISNVLARVISHQPAFTRHHLALDETLSVGSAGASLTLTSPSGVARPLKSADATSSLSADERGEYTLAQRGRAIDSLWAAPLSAVGSDISSRSSSVHPPLEWLTSTGAKDTSTTVRRWLALAVLLVVAANFWLLRSDPKPL